FNFGGVAGAELFFKFNDGSTAEFAGGKDRVYTLLGTNDAIPALTWNVPYGASHSFHVVFNCTANCSTAKELREFPSAGGWAKLANLGNGMVDVAFQNRDLVGSPLLFKAWYGVSGPDDYEAGSNHAL